MDKRVLVGLDIGTSGTKVILADETGKVLASAVKEYPLYAPKPGWAEQNPSDWWRAVCEGCQQVLSASGVDKGRLVGLSLSGQMHGLVALDEEDQVIRPAMLWCDQRTQRQCDWITQKAGGLEGLLRYTNNRMLTGYTGGTLLWMKELEPD